MKFRGQLVPGDCRFIGVCLVFEADFNLPYRAGRQFDWPVEENDGPLQDFFESAFGQ